MADSKETVKALTDKEEMFCQEYIRDFNATKAHERAGYAPNASFETRRVDAYRVLIKPHVSARIDELKKERVNRLKIDSDWMVMSLSNIAGANFMDIMEVIEEANPMGADEDAPKAKTIVFKDLKEIPPEIQAVIKQVKYTKYGYEVSFEDKKWAYEMLAKHIGFYEKDNAQKRDSALDNLSLEDRIKVVQLIQSLENGNNQ